MDILNISAQRISDIAEIIRILDSFDLQYFTIYRSMRNTFVVRVDYFFFVQAEKRLLLLTELTDQNYSYQINRLY